MKKLLGLLGVAAACGVCCAFPVALPLFGGLATSGLGITFGWEGAVVSAAFVVGLVFLVRGRQARRAACQSSTAAEESACGCGTTATACTGVAR